MESFDYCIVGAGVIGLACAYKLSQQQPDKTFLLIETHSQYGSETSSRNSEVIHAGIYYPAGSLKARLCQAGKKQLYTFCQNHNISHRRIGKLIIATSEKERQTLQTIKRNALNNDVNLSWLSQAECLQLEPNIHAEVALYSDSTGIINSHEYMQKLLHLAQLQGVLYSPNTRFIHAQKETQGFTLLLDTNDGEYRLQCHNIINAAGLYAPVVADNIDILAAEHVPPYHFCRGHYYSYSGKTPQGERPFSHLIYPVPSKNTQGLGIHATLDMAGQIRFGPDTEFITEINYQINQHQQHLKQEHFARAIKHYFPTLQAHKLQFSYSGIRPKLSGEDEAAKDFVIQTSQDHNVLGLVNLFGIESPGLTASLAIADQVCAQFNDKFGWLSH